MTSRTVCLPAIVGADPSQHARERRRVGEMGERVGGDDGVESRWGKRPGSRQVGDGEIGSNTEADSGRAGRSDLGGAEVVGHTPLRS